MDDRLNVVLVVRSPKFDGGNDYVCKFAFEDDAEIEKSMERIRSLMDEAQQEFMRLRSRVGFVAETVEVKKESADSPN